MTVFFLLAVFDAVDRLAAFLGMVTVFFTAVVVLGAVGVGVAVAIFFFVVLAGFVELVFLVLVVVVLDLLALENDVKPWAAACARNCEGE